MKKTNCRTVSGKVIPFHPYAKNKQYYINKIVDWSLAAVTSMGAVTALCFLIML